MSKEDSDSDMEDVSKDDEMEQEEDSSSSDDDDQEIKEQERRVAELKKSISKNAYNYDVHIQLIALLHKMGELERLREAREGMSKVFPLTEELWLSWLRDEIKLVATPAEREKVHQLFERAIQDYLSVDIWLEWCQFCIGDAAEKGAEAVRRIFDRALTSAGLHVAKGAVLWEAYREFEGVLLANVQTPPGSVPTPQDLDQLKLQRKRVHDLFKRQLAVPLLDMEATREELRDFSVGDEENAATYGYDKAIAKLKQIYGFEENLLRKAGDELLEEYKIYIQHEKSDPARTQILYERAIVSFPLNADLWLDYIKYLDRHLKIKEVSEPVITRALRNVPWDARLWVVNLRCGEKAGRDHLTMQSCLEMALASGISSAEDFRMVWEAYIDYLRRRVPWESDDKEQIKVQVEEMRKCSAKACEHLAEMFGIEGDPQCTILRAWARTEAARCGNLERARKLWSDVMSFDLMNQSATYWLEYILMERSCGDEKHLRKLFGRALNSATDWPEGIADAWISYEREQGCLESFEFSLEKVDERMERLKVQRLKVQEAQETANKKNKDNKLKRKRDIKEATEVKNQPLVKKERAEHEFKSPLPVGELKPKSPAKRRPPPPGYKPDPESEVKATGALEISSNTGRAERDHLKDSVSVFVSNLDFETTEEEVKQFLGPNVINVDFAKGFQGRSKGFGTVEMKTSQDVEDALKKDREKIRNRPIFISRCNSDKQSRQKQFNFKLDMERNKLFVRNIPHSTTKEDLEELFRQYGALKDVRIVTYRNGNSKGLAYVEYEDEADAAQALLKTDNLEFQGRVISVAISRPPARKEAFDTDIPSLGGRSRQAIQAQNLLPRAVRLSIPATKESTNGVTVVQSKKSNDDFRKMLLGNK